ncbi:cytochrome b [Thalassobaculum sp.]|uniref:cytochrome b n=1 Tax=Thalassobaculum sp. TaxID=2022740 RepID=UPI0032EBEB9D
MPESSLPEPATGFAPLQRVLHWVVAGLVLATLAGGLVIGRLGFDRVTALLGGSGRDVLYEYHKTFGLIVLGLMLIRLFVRIDRGRPAYNPPIKPWQQAVSQTVHYLFYVLLLAMPVLGWLATDMSDYPVEFFAWDVPQVVPKSEAIGALLYDWHRYVGWTIALLIVLHVGAGLMHWLILRDGVMGRIALPVRRKSRR